MNQDQQLHEAMEVLGEPNTFPGILGRFYHESVVLEALTVTQQAAPSRGAVEFTPEMLADLVPQTATILEMKDGSRKTCFTYAEVKQFAAALLEASTQREQPAASKPGPHKRLVDCGECATGCTEGNCRKYPGKPEPQAQAGEPGVVALDGDDPVVAKFDNEAVDRFAFAMKSKMAKQRAKGYYGWADERTCPTERLQSRLADHIGKGDPVDVGNFAMMLFNRKERTTLPVNALCSVMGSDSVSCAYCAEAHAVLDSDESKIIRNAKDGYPDGREPRELKLAERVSALCTYAADWKRWCLKSEEAITQGQEELK